MAPFSPSERASAHAAPGADREDSGPSDDTGRAARDAQ